MSDPRADYAAVCELTTAWPPPLYANHKGRCEFRVRNCGALPLTGPPVLHLVWQDVHEQGRGASTPLPEPLPPGGEVDLWVPVVAPLRPGAYVLVATLEVAAPDDGGTARHLEMARLVWDVAALADWARGGITLAAPLPPVRRGELFWMALRVRNQSGHVWRAAGRDQVELWLTTESADGHRNRRRSPLAADLAPGYTTLLLAGRHAPEQPGPYSMTVTALKQGGIGFDRCADFHAASCELEVIDPAALGQAEFSPMLAASTAYRNEITRVMYADWFAATQALPPATVASAIAAVEDWPKRPVFSLLIDAVGAEAAAVSSTLQSLTEQFYPNWHAVVVGGPELGSEIPERVQQMAVGSDASGDALAAARGEWCLMLAAGDTLEAHALMFLAGAAVRDPELGWIYCDSDVPAADGGRMPSFHCSPNHELALTSGAMMHHAAFRTALARRAGEFAGALAKYRLGLALLCGSAPVRAAFVPHVLLHAVAPAAPLGEAGAALLQAHLDRAGADALVSVQPDSGLLSINWPLPSEPPLVSILIPTRDRLDLLALCVDSILALTTYKNFELIVIDNGSLEPATLAWLYERQQAGILEVVRVDGPFNWSRLNNRAVTMARGQVLCLLNNDTEVITPGWLDELVSQALRPDVGVVGPALLYPNGSVQNAGLYLDFAVPDRPQRLGRLCWGLDWSHSRLRVAQEVSAVSGACLVVRREVYAAAGGMDEQHLAAAMNDVDFNFRVRKSLRLRVVWTPHARLYHRALASRGRPNSPEQIAQTNYERAHFNACWHDAAMDEPAFSPDMRGCDAPVLAPPHRARAAATARRLNTARRRVLFVHVPKTAGEAMRHLLEAEYPGTLCAFSARTMLRCYDGDAVTLADTARRFAGADIGIGHVAHGFGALLGQDCIYATVMRDPVARTVSQFGHLLAGLASPVRGSWLSDAPIEVWLRCGVLRGNLMLHRILGERPEPVGWARFEHGSFPFPPQFCGFRLPEALWEGRADLLRAAPELPPETDEGLLVRAIEQLRESFCFVGRQEALDAHLRALGDVLGWGKASPPAVHNQARTKVAPLSASQIELVEAYNRLDRALLNYIDALPGGMILRPELIYAGRPVSESKE